jgi:hypothetical protein
VARRAVRTLALKLKKNEKEKTEVTYTTELAFEACQTVFTEA